MYEALGFLIRFLEIVFAVANWSIRTVNKAVNLLPLLPRGIRYALLPVGAYLAFALILVYVFAPIRGFVGQFWHSDELTYASERWLTTAIYDSSGEFVGAFDPRLDSQRDVNFTGRPIELAGDNYVASPDHKSIPTRTVPDHYWQCLRYHEDRHLGGLFNPFGIDLFGVLKIPYTTVKRSISGGGVQTGVGGSTLSMQLVRSFYKLTPHSAEGVTGKLRRKLLEWWHAPVFHWSLTSGGNLGPLKHWTANHLPLAQRTSGQPLYGVEQTARVIFGKPASELSIAEQYVLASAVNRPILVLEGSRAINRIRLNSWKRITKGRAAACAKLLLDDEKEKEVVTAELEKLGNGPPDPRVSKGVADALAAFSKKVQRRAEANPIIRANLLTPAARYGTRRELLNIYGYEWRNHVRGIELTLDVSQNLQFRNDVKAALATLQRKYKSRIRGPFTLDLNSVRTSEGALKKVPDVVIAAANEKGEIVRYFESRDTASYFGAWGAREQKSGRYDPEREIRSIASVGKILAAIALANEGKDKAGTLYVDKRAPKRGLESCKRNGTLRRGRRAEVVFACSLTGPLENRLAQLGQSPSQKLIRSFGFVLPKAQTAAGQTPASTAVVKGLIAGSARNVHRLSATVLASLTGRSSEKVGLPSLIRKYDGVSDKEAILALQRKAMIVPDNIIRPQGRAVLAELLSSPLCYQHRGKRYGTLKSISDWCAKRRKDVTLHFAKTGTQVTHDRNATVDVWIAGGLQFSSGRAYSYVVLVGTGNVNEPWAQGLHSAQIAAPLVDVLLKDLRRHGFSKQKTGGKKVLSAVKKR